MTHRQTFLFDDAVPHLSGCGLIFDYFAGAGGASTGIEWALGRSPDVAINHCEHAVRVHELNHPRTDHVRVDVWDVDPVRHLPPGDVSLCWFSPDCRHFSRAKGSTPVSRKVRGLAWVALRVAGRRRPRVIVIENVPEFVTWGPVRKRRFGRHKGKVMPVSTKVGQSFRRFIDQFRALGYVVEYRVLNAADHGAPTSRKRLFLIARCDGAPVVWPDATHGPGRAHPYRTAAECIDWSIHCPSIFDRKRPLAAATCKRIADGLRRYVIENPRPFLAPVDGGLVAHTMVQTGHGEHDKQRPRSLDLGVPLGTVVTSTKHALVAVWLAKHYGGVVGHGVDRPIGTITTVDHHSLVACHLSTLPMPEDRRNLVASFLTTYYGQGTGQSLDDPMRTVVTKDRFGLVTVVVDGQTYAVVDIGLRMLTPRELARAQGFDDTFQLIGTQTDQVARVGNSVCPPLARAIVAANLGEPSRGNGVRL
jgi:DNA (cytosine-5)-methyltransferase 1